MKINLYAVIGIVILMIIFVLFVPVILSKPHASGNKVTSTDFGPWVGLGSVSNGIRSGMIFKRQDPDTGATIYVLVGTELGGIYVLPAPEKAKQ